MINIIEKIENNIDIIQMKNEELEIIVSNFGCTIIKVLMKDKNGTVDDVVLGYSTMKEYQEYDAYLGALVGRVANRIGKGTFSLHGETFSLAINNGPNHLHGGIKGFSYQTFDYEILDEETIVFHYVSKDGEEGYPGTLKFDATYRLVGHTLFVTYTASSDKDTLINITNHSYFNLSGKKENIDHHTLLIKGSQFACIDGDGLPTGKIRDVENTPFDFRKEIEIKKQIEKEDIQLTLGKGFDHPFLFDEESDQVILVHPGSGRKLTVSTTLPQAQIYTANYLDGRTGKYGDVYNPRDGICIETQNMPDAIHLEDKPTTILKKGEVYEETTSYTFEVLK